jgi:hypothetical protein
VHLLGDLLPRPCRPDVIVKLHDVQSPSPKLACVKYDVVMMIIQHQRDVKLLANREEVMNGLADVVVFKN